MSSRVIRSRWTGVCNQHGTSERWCLFFRCRLAAMERCYEGTAQHCICSLVLRICRINPHRKYVSTPFVCLRKLVRKIFTQSGGTIRMTSKCSSVSENSHTEVDSADTQPSIFNIFLFRYLMTLTDQDRMKKNYRSFDRRRFSIACHRRRYSLINVHV